MKQRSISAIGVVLVGLVPALLGGWVFAVVFTAIAAIAFHEAMTITNPAKHVVHLVGMAVVILAGILAMLDVGMTGFATLIAIAVGFPLIGSVFAPDVDGIAEWTSVTASSLYLALPAFAAISLRQTDSWPSSDWIASVAGAMPGVRDATGGGLAWFLMALLITWLSDTFAYLVGKSMGKRKLIPRVSPNKTVEGAAGGLIAAALTALICNWAFGMDLHVGLALLIGLGLGVLGQLGDLSESMLKRARGVKDSGNLIPGHGGMLDRIDALIFVLVAAWLIAPVVS